MRIVYEEKHFFIRILSILKSISYLCSREHENKETYCRLDAFGSVCANALFVVGSCSQIFQFFG